VDRAEHLLDRVAGPDGDDRDGLGDSGHGRRVGSFRSAGPDDDVTVGDRRPGAAVLGRPGALRARRSEQRGRRCTVPSDWAAPSDWTAWTPGVMI